MPSHRRLRVCAALAIVVAITGVALLAILREGVETETTSGGPSKIRGLGSFEKLHPTKAPKILTINVDEANEKLLACWDEVSSTLEDALPAIHGDPLPASNLSSLYHLRDPGPYATDRIFADRLAGSPHLMTSEEDSADFVYLPLRMLHYHFCRTQGEGEKRNEALRAVSGAIEAAATTVQRSPRPSPYPKLLIVLPRIRHDYEELFDDRFLKRFGKDIVLVGIEGDTWTTVSDVAAFIQIPYTSRFRFPHLFISDPLQGPAIPRLSLHGGERPHLVLFAGRSEADYPTNTPFNGMACRAAIYDELASVQGLGHRVVVVDEPMNDLNGLYEKMAHSMFCMEPAGDSATRRGFFDAIFTGCIPVITRRSSYSMLFAPDISLADFTVHIPEDDIIASSRSYLRHHSLHRPPTLLERLEAVSPSRVAALQAGLRNVAPLLQWSVPGSALQPRERVWTGGKDLKQTAPSEGWPRDAFGMTLRQLARLRDGKFGRQPLLHQAKNG